MHTRERERENILPAVEESFRLSVSQLPGWAQRQVQARPSIAKSFSTSDVEGRGRGEGGGAGGRGQQMSAVEGCWAQVGVA